MCLGRKAFSKKSKTLLLLLASSGEERRPRSAAAGHCVPFWASELYCAVFSDQRATYHLGCGTLRFVF